MKAVLFDLGGTLLHYRREEVFRGVLKEKGIDVRINEVLRAVLIDRREIVKGDPNVCRISSLKQIPLILSQ